LIINLPSEYNPAQENSAQKNRLLCGEGWDSALRDTFATCGRSRSRTAQTWSWDSVLRQKQQRLVWGSPYGRSCTINASNTPHKTKCKIYLGSSAEN